MENITLLQTVKPIHKADIVYRVDSVVYFSTSILFHFITQYESNLLILDEKVYILKLKL